MKAEVQFNDFTGSIAADISDIIAAKKGNYISSIGEYFDVDQERFKVVGISLTGISDFKATLICVDKQKSTESKEHIVKMTLELDEEGQKEMLNLLFKRLNLVLFDAGEKHYSTLECDEEIAFNEYHVYDYYDVN
ncbi:hypothetical protein HX057_11385 [Myroides odoratimimus]|uniref:Uncharacterized protein n=3 Tax=Myroides odoratimimus TaxID=76832 RepID=A0A0S7EB54_9FLAO|nr:MULTISPECIES: hypothetical protein [Myroides]AJA67703.1 hypothetical protein MYRA21_0493 [Myroides sp. A21]ALU24995.1 hypothetical protein AS202_01875 [Myroides odoratimimus]EHO05869.1 hypothetical protein HMPREF9712_03445 [Myroides odoratimimus CCUG 10230]MDM1060206.1 hypothetical protein [Myroides odoratimimus]MDM1065313.1 hypothetical protein [Myroides odoratimimus]